MIGGMVLEVGAARFTLYPGTPIPPALARLLGGKGQGARRAAHRVAVGAAISSPEDEHARALQTGCWAPDLQSHGDDAIVAAAPTTTTRRNTTMSTTAAASATTNRKSPGRKPAAKRPTPEQLKAMTPDERAVLAPAGLGGKALEHFIATGETAAEQTRKAKAEREAAAKEAKRKAASDRAKAAGTRPPVARRDGITAMQAAEKVLRKAKGPLSVSEIAKRAVKLPDFKPTGKTPEASVAARVHVSAKTPDGTFVRVARGIVDVRALNPQGAETRPAKN